MSQNPENIESQVSDAAQENNGRPPLDKWDPEFSGDIDIRVARNGDWFYRGEKMQREALVRLFTTILRREDDGDYYLVTPVEKWRIQVEDTPLLVNTLEVSGDGSRQVIDATTNVGDRVRIGRNHPLRIDSYPDSDEPRPLVYLYHGLEARLVTAAFYDLAKYVTEKPDGSPNDLGVWSEGIFFELGDGG